MTVERGQVWTADLGEPDDSEPGYNRPVLIVQNDAFNRSRLHTLVAVVLSTNLRIRQSGQRYCGRLNNPP